MIVKMDKYSFILFHSDLDKFLLNIQSLGIVDITRQNKAIDDKSRELFGRSKRYQSVIKKIKQYFEKASETEKNSLIDLSNPDFKCVEDILKYGEDLILNKEQWEAEVEQLKK